MAKKDKVNTKEPPAKVQGLMEKVPKKEPIQKAKKEKENTKRTLALTVGPLPQ